MDSCLDAGGAEEGLQVEVVVEVSGRCKNCHVVEEGNSNPQKHYIILNLIKLNV